MIESRLRSLLGEALDAARSAGDLDVNAPTEIELTRPPRREHGDWSTNVALMLQKAAGRRPRQVAETIVQHLPSADWVLKVEIAGPGFVNFFLSDAWLHDACREVLDRAERYGSTDEGRGIDVNLEFVSINPTGPLHVAHGRHAAVGDSVARLLAFTGHDVVREYYFNDAGKQMELFGASVASRYLELLDRETTFPEDGYQGDYVRDIAEQIVRKEGEHLADLSFDELTDRMREHAYEIVLGWIKDTLERFGVHFDVWFMESGLYESGKARETMERLRVGGHLFEDGGATWLRSTDHGDNRDRPLIKSSGEATYLAGDLAYHVEKFERGFDHLIVLLGADHHGQVASLHAGMRALGYDDERIEIIIMQFVHLLRSGEAVAMGKRTGSFVTLDELIDEVGADAARYTFCRTSVDRDARFDIDEVKKQSDENPVFYVQYAHARIASILRHAEESGVVDAQPPEWGALTEEAEVELMRSISEFPETVAIATRDRAPHRLCTYAEELARRFHRFYTECRVVTDDEALTHARLALSRAAKQVLANALGLLGVEPPERMEREQ